AMWSHRLGRGHVSLGLVDHQGVWFGYIGAEGFDAFAWGLTNAPGVAVGFPWRGTLLSFTSEAFFTFAQHTKLGEATVTSPRTVAFSGVGTTFVCETMLGRGNIAYY